MSQFKIQVDARLYQPKDKHSTIFNAFHSLQPGEKMELVNDHDPKPLHYQLKAEYANQFEWEYLAEGPEVWRVSILKK
jgi:uncharacterized protein (DUF2249 family)